MKPIEFTPQWQPPPDAKGEESGRSDLACVKFTPAWESSPQKLGETAAAAARQTAVPIVIAEDDPVSRELISTLVRKWGFRTIVTQDGHEAMGALRVEQGAVVAILDWMMPGMDGPEVCRRIREGHRLVHIILLTARGGKENLVQGLQAGADDYLVKPFDKDELFARIQVALRILNLQTTLRDRVQELETALSEVRSLKLQLIL